MPIRGGKLVLSRRSSARRGAAPLLLLSQAMEHGDKELLRSLLVLLVCLWAAPASAQTIMPEWFGRTVESWSGARVPQVESRASLFRGAQPSSADRLTDALLVCRVHVDEPENGRWDLFADPDLRVVVSGGGQRAVLFGTENSRTEVFTLPHTSVRRGQSLSFAISDRDVTFDEHIATIEARYEGSLPFSAQAGVAELECRGVDAGRATQGRDAGLARAEPHVLAMEAARPDLRAPDLGRPTAASLSGRAALLEAASWAGWGEERVHAVRARYDGAERSFAAAIRGAVRDAAREAPAAGAPVALAEGTVSVGRLSCGAPAVRRALPSIEEPRRSTLRCVLEMQVNGAPEPRAALGAVDALDANGGVHVASDVVVGAPGPDGTPVIAAFGDRFSARGALLRVGSGQRTLLRLR